MKIIADNFTQVQQMHDKFELSGPQTPSALTDEEYRFRIKAMFEELFEYCEAVFDEHPVYIQVTKNVVNELVSTSKIKKDISQDDLAEQFDALVDLSIFTLGTADRQGFPFNEGFQEVMRANMEKELGEGRRGFKKDLIKPEGWTPPDMVKLIRDKAPFITLG